MIYNHERPSSLTRQNGSTWKAAVSTMKTAVRRDAEMRVARPTNGEVTTGPGGLVQLMSDCVIAFNP